MNSEGFYVRINNELLFAKSTFFSQIQLQATNWNPGNVEPCSDDSRSNAQFLVMLHFHEH